MKFTLSWLQKFLDTDASLEEIANKLTMIGLEVEEIIDHSAQLNSFIVAEILETHKHPEADKLKVCKVLAGDETLQIVCGASNARKGIKVALARVGTLIPNGNFKIKDSTIRGINSMGMLCSAEELNLENASEGIIELPLSAQIGEPITKILGLEDPVLHINITPNRADGLGVYGIARDLAASGLGKLKELQIPKIKETLKACHLSVKDIDACPLFTARTIDNIDPKAESPAWLKNYLKNVGVNPRTPVVDVTNYISYTFGQPMHAYDADKLDGDLVVDTLKTTSKFLALNGKEYDLELGDLVISDSSQIQCLAGIMGGNNSACDENTSKIILEAASFKPEAIIKTGRRLMLNTDGRYRHERGLDRAFTLKALDYATNMINEICGGTNSAPVNIDHVDKSPRTLDFPVKFLAERSGMSLVVGEICDILEKLGFICAVSGESIKITIPSWRLDVSIKEDIVEEIVRIYGYDKIPEIELPSSNIARIIPKDQKRYSDIKRLFAANGYTELVTWSFMESKKAALFSELKEELFLANPISADLDYMRPSILPNLLKSIYNNSARGFKDLSFFEVGPIFLNDEAETMNSATCIRTGTNEPKNSHSKPRAFDIFDIKADMATILAYSGLELDKCQIHNTAPSYYHPGRSASVNLGKNILGFFGQIHPSILKAFDIEQDVMAFEINISNLPMTKDKYGKKSEYTASDYQAIQRDYAFIVDKAQQVGEIINLVKNTDKNLIRSVNLFDIYAGDKIEKDKKSIAFSVQIQDNHKTLNEADIESVSSAIINAVTTKFGAKIRDS